MTKHQLISTQITCRLHHMHTIKYNNAVLKIHSNHSPIVEGNVSLEDPHTYFDVGLCIHLNALEKAPTNSLYKGIVFLPLNKRYENQNGQTDHQ